jgi:uncharacterized membrane protein YphA (DoxX/SURF4 family)
MSEPKTGRSLSKIVYTGIRILFGLAFFAFGLMGFFMPMTPPPDLADGAKAFDLALSATGYMLPLICGTQVLAGLLCLINRFVPLALVIIFPFLVNSLAFHIFLEHTGLPMAGIFVAMNLFLAWNNRKAYASLLTAKFAG